MNKFKNIFQGLEIAYGQYQPGERGENGKQQGKAFIVRGTVTDELWDRHLRGEGAALGIIPITENNDCRWGCIDIDEYNFDHTSLVKSIRNRIFIYQRKHSCIIDAIKIKRDVYHTWL
jgi:hypothetical protein